MRKFLSFVLCLLSVVLSPAAWAANGGETHDIALKVGEPTTVTFVYNKDYTITAFGAVQVADTSGKGDLILKFTESGSMTVPTDLIAGILVVGGGGAGAKGSSGKYGSSGNGGKGSERTGEKMPAGTYAIKVGAGGQSACAAGGVSSIGGVAEFTTIECQGASALTDTSSHSSNYKAGTDGYAGNNGYSDITGNNLKYGAGGAKASSTSGKHGTDGAANTGNGGVGGYNSSSEFGKGGSGVVIVRFTDVAKVRTPIAVPTVATGLVYDWTNQVGVAKGEGYALTGVSVTNAVGTFTAFATPDDDHCWEDKSRTTKELAWSIACRQATVTVIDTNKVSGAEEPFFRTRNENFIADDPVELKWTAWRTNTSEAVGTYDIVILGEKEQSGYEITYVSGTLTITEAPPPGPKVVPVTDLDGPITGVEPKDVKIVSESGVDITAAFTLTGSAAEGVTAMLNPKGAVTIGEGAAAETITVLPELAETGDKAVEPFEVKADEVDIGVKTIPGLDYKLNRSTDVSKIREGETVDEKRATSTRTQLRDQMKGGKPEKAFYVIEVGM